MDNVDLSQNKTLADLSNARRSGSVSYHCRSPIVLTMAWLAALLLRIPILTRSNPSC